MPAFSEFDAKAVSSLTPLTIKSGLEPAPPVVASTVSVKVAAELMQAHGQPWVVVVDEQQKILGVLTEQGIVKALALSADATQSIPLGVLRQVAMLSVDGTILHNPEVGLEPQLPWSLVVDSLGQVCGLVPSHGGGEHHRLFSFPEALANPTPNLLELLQGAPDLSFQAIFHQINVGLCQATLDGWLVNVNPGLCQMLGYTREELVQKRFQQITHSEDLDLDLEQYQQLLAGNQNSMFVEKRYLHKQGYAVWVALTVCLVRDTEGLPLFSIGVSQDISDRKAAELALHASHQHITNILESITDAFFALDYRWRFTYLNQRAEQMLKKSRNDLLGQNIWYQFPEMLGTLFSGQFRQAMGKRKSVCFEEDFKPLNSWCEVRVYPTQEGLAVYFQDITDRKQAYEKIEHQIRREQALNRVIQAIRRSLNLDTVFTTAAVEIAHLLQADQVDIQTYNPQTQCWTVVAEHRSDETITSFLHQVIADHENAISARLKRLEVVELNAASRWAKSKDILPGRWLLMPLQVSGPLPWGCLAIRRHQDYGIWQSSEIDLVKTVADQLAIAIQQAQTLEQAQRELQERQRAEARLKEAQRIAHTGSWELELPGLSVTWSEEMFRIFGLSPEAPPLTWQQQLAVLDQGDGSRTAQDCPGERWQKHIFDACNTGRELDLEGCIRRPDGMLRYVHWRGRPQYNSEGQIVSLVGTLTDISERKLVEDRLFHDARHDALTGIPNRTYFMEQLNAAVEVAKQQPTMIFSLLFIDLDRFKVINDSLGHVVGDQLLIECAGRLSSVVREGDLVARLGGDEFAILLDQTDEVGDALSVAQRIHQVLQVPVVLEGREIFISASIGISSNWTGSVEAVDFLRDADTAMYQAKNNGRGCSALFKPAMYEQVTTQLTLENDLQRALQRQELSLHYQPIVNLKTGQLMGFEALLRWHHSRWGNISPAKFIPLTEETGLILSIGEWTQREACQQLQQWRQQYPQATNLTMSVNLSVKQFSSPNLISTIDEILAETGLSAGPRK